METIKTFIEGIKAKDIADIFISIAILVIFFVLSIWLPRLLLKIWKVNEKDKKVLKENETSVNDYKSGKQNALKFLMGMIMKETKGSANPKIVNDMLIDLLSKDVN